MMNHGAMLWGAALYNNGAFPLKNYRFGQAYGPNGEPLRLENPCPSRRRDAAARHFAVHRTAAAFPIGQPGNILRIFEKGGEKQLQLGIPNPVRRAGQSGAAFVRARPRHVESHRSGFS